MIIYQNDKTGFLKDAFAKDIEDIILRAFKVRTGRAVAISEVLSWKESLVALAKVLNDEGIPGDCGVAIEYGIPQTAKRIDFILSGQDSGGAEQLIIIELKQWQSARKTDRDAVVTTRFSHGEREVSHPSYQAWSYASLLKNFNEAVYEDDIALQPCAYLHNYVDDGVLTDSFYEHYVTLAPLFLKGEAEREKLRHFIKQHVRYGDGRSMLYRIENGRIRPSKSLAESLAGMLAGKSEFVLVDDQKVVYESALSRAAAASEQSKRVVIVEGGPGTGKSVVAVNLLVALTGRRLVAKYVTKNAAPRAVFESVLAGTHRKSQISNLFTGSGSFTDTYANTFDALIVDEAHRLNEKSGIYGNLGTNQIQELIGSAKCSIFFLDEDQRVTFKDIGERAEIERFARQAGATVTTLTLTSQFRCNGSDGFLAWLDHTLDIRPTANDKLDVAEFDFRVFSSPEQLRREIMERNKIRNKARMVAGYCWDWRSKKNPTAQDVVIPEHHFAMRWNLTKDGGLWMVAPESASEIGCIHTCQGLEVDYIGVIVGPDLAFRDNRVVAQPAMRSKHDKSLNGYKRLLEIDPGEAARRAELIIKNTYRTLMTRGMKGCYVYFTDGPLERYVRSRLSHSYIPTKGIEKILRAAKPSAPHVVRKRSDSN
ncbi:MAG: DUF2075 domain-containing protein [Steroidobacteraceae bacterium]